MAEGELRCDKNQQLKVIAQEIIVDQTQEIALVRLARGEPPPQPGSSPTQIHAGAVSTAPLKQLARPRCAFTPFRGGADMVRPSHRTAAHSGLPPRMFRLYYTAPESTWR